MSDSDNDSYGGNEEYEDEIIDDEDELSRNSGSSIQRDSDEEDEESSEKKENEEEEDEEEDIVTADLEEYIDPSVLVSIAPDDLKFTSYEKGRIMGYRASQISDHKRNRPTTLTVFDIAPLELIAEKEGVSPKNIQKRVKELKENRQTNLGLDDFGIIDALNIADREFKLGKLPTILERRLPNGVSYFYNIGKNGILTRVIDKNAKTKQKEKSKDNKSRDSTKTNKNSNSNKNSNKDKSKNVKSKDSAKNTKETPIRAKPTVRVNKRK